MGEALPRRIGVLCSYVPRELLAAAGFEAQVASGPGASGSEAGLPANLCAHVRQAAAFLAGPGAAALAGVVVADSCFPMFRLWDHLEAVSAPIPRWLLRVPRRDTPDAVDFFRDELERLGASLAAAAGLAGLSREGIAAAIDERNRRLERCLQAAEGLLSGRPPRLTASLLGLLSGAAPAEREDARVDSPDSSFDRPSARRRRPRVMLVGSYFLTGALMDLVHRLGGDVRAVESCEHYRMGTSAIALEAGGDPYRALAAGYLGQPSCPRMERGAERPEAAGALADAGRIDGVVYLLMKGCTMHAYAVPRWQERLGRAGVPLLALEIADADWSQPRLVTRLEAFLESLAERAAP